MSRDDSINNPLEDERSEESEHACRRDAQETAQVQVKERSDPARKPSQFSWDPRRNAAFAHGTRWTPDSPPTTRLCRRRHIRLQTSVNYPEFHRLHL